MKFELEEPGRLKIVIDSQDMQSMNMDFGRLDYAHTDTRKMICDLLALGRHKTDFEPDSGRLLIEVFPRTQGGCVFYFTSLNPQIKRNKLRLRRHLLGPFVFEFDSLDTMIRVCRSLARMPKRCLPKSELYSLEGGYRLTVYTIPGFSERLFMLLREFGKMSGEGRAAAAFLEEHGRLLASPDAVKQLTIDS